MTKTTPSSVAGHTAGPWTFDDDWSRLPTVFGADGQIVATIEKNRVIDGWVSPQPDREANARLIAAAPDMLAALEAAKVFGGGWPEAVWQQVNAALAKAKP